MAQGVALWRWTGADAGSGLIPAICPIDGNVTDVVIWTSSVSQTIVDCYFTDPTEATLRAFYQVQASDGPAPRQFPFDAPGTNPNVDVEYDDSGPKPIAVVAGQPLYAQMDEDIGGIDILIFGLIIVSGAGRPSTVNIGDPATGIVRLG